MIGSTVDRGKDTSVSASQAKQSSVRIITTCGLNMASNNIPSLPRSASTVFTSSSKTLSTVESTDNSLRHYQSNMVFSSPEPHAAWSTEMIIHGSMSTHQQHLGSLAAQATSLCRESSSLSWTHASGMQQERRESTRKADRSKMASSLQGVITTLPSLSSTISPSNAGLEMFFLFKLRLMGPLQLMVTRYRIRHSGEQVHFSLFHEINIKGKGSFTFKPLNVHEISH